MESPKFLIKGVQVSNFSNILISKSLTRNDNQINASSLKFIRTSDDSSRPKTGKILVQNQTMRSSTPILNFKLVGHSLLK